MAASDYVILIPTGRHYYLNRLVDYYDYYGESSRVMVLDCCPTPWERTPPPGLAYFHLPGMSFMGRLKHALDHTDAGYFSMCADDDFVIPAGIRRSVVFLEKNRDYSAAYGRYVRFSVKDVVSYGEQYPLENHRDLDQDDPALRLLSILDHYIQLFYAVHTRRVFARLTELVEMHDDVNFMNACGERIFTLLPPLMGKVKFLNDAQVLREQENHKSSRHLSYAAMAKAWVVCREMTLRLMQEYRADTAAVRQLLDFFIEKWIYVHFRNGIETVGEPRPAGRGADMADWLARDIDPLAYITYRGDKTIPSDFRGISRMAFDDQAASEEAVRVADRFLKRFVRDYVRDTTASKKST